jgi:dimethylaniline monooxygenase (N-oxide forming)
MSDRSVHLSNGEILPCDAAVFATGWDYKSTLFSENDALQLGMTAYLANEDPETASYWQKLTTKADQEVIEKLPILAHPPPHYERPVTYTPFRLYRYQLPTSLASANDRSLVFCGLVTSVQTSVYAEVSALWAVAWLENLLSVPLSKEEMDYDIAKVNAFCQRRYLSRGRTRQIASAEIQEVTDLLMKDMGLKVYRKNNWLKEIFAPSRSQDYKGVVEELVRKEGKGGNKS